MRWSYRSLVDNNKKLWISISGTHMHWEWPNFTGINTDYSEWYPIRTNNNKEPSGQCNLRKTLFINSDNPASQHKREKLNAFDEVANMIVNKCAAAQYASRGAVHSTLRNSPWTLPFQRDMLIPIKLPIHCNDLLGTYQRFIKSTNLRESIKRKQYNHTEGDMILLLNKKKH